VKDDNEKYYYGIIKEIMQVEYSGEPTKQLVVFNCEWFDNTINHGIKFNMTLWRFIVTLQLCQASFKP